MRDSVRGATRSSPRAEVEDGAGGAGGADRSALASPGPSGQERSPRTVAWLALTTAVVTAYALQSARFLFPLAYAQAEAHGYERGAALAALPFAVLLLLPAIARVARIADRRWLLPALLLGAAALRVGTPFRPSFALVAVFVAISFAALGLLVEQHLASGTAPLLATAIVVGSVGGTVERILFGTWDPVWQANLPARASGVASALGLTALAVVAVRLPRADLALGPDPRSRTVAGGLAPGIVLGAFLALAVGFWQNVAYVASSGRFGAGAAVAVLAGGVAALLGVRTGEVVAASAAGTRRVAALAGAVALATSGWLLPTVTGAAVAVLVVVAPFVATALLTATLLGARRGRGVLLGWGVGAVAFLLLVLLYQVAYEIALPFPNRLLPAGAGALFALAAAPGPASTRRPGASDAQTRRWWRSAVAFALPATVLVPTAVAWATPEGDAHHGTGRVRVVTWNVHEAVTGDGRLDLAGLARTLDRLDPDVVVLLEVGRGWALSGTVDLQRWLERRFAMRGVWAPAADGQFGTLVLTDLPVLDAEWRHIPSVAGAQRRSAVRVRLSSAPAPLTVVATQFQHRNTAEAIRTRVADAQAVLALWGGASRTILAGDLNPENRAGAQPGDPVAWPEVRAVEAAGFRTTQATDTCAVPTSGAHCSDFVFATRDLAMAPVRVEDDSRFDHRPVVADVIVR